MRSHFNEPITFIAGFFILLGTVIFLAPQIDTVITRLGVKQAAQVEAAFGTGKTWHVGPTREYKTPSAVAGLVQDGDTVEIDGGVYRCDTGVKWTKNNLTIRGVNGRPHLDARGCSIPGGKGIWNPSGINFRVENIEFSGAQVGDRNGSGIRYDGGGDVYISNSYFHHNQNGILFTPHPDKFPFTTNLTVEYTEFAYNGDGGGGTHNIYVNNTNRFIFRHNYSHHSIVGHLVKTRALENHILYNRLVDLADGNSSYNIDVPDGGVTYIIGNVIQQGPRSDNRGIIAYGAERRSGFNRTNKLYMVNNTVHNTHPGTSEMLKLFAGKGLVVEEAKIINNLFIGLEESRLVTQANRGRAQLINNKIVDGSGFADLDSYNYYLQSGSPAIDAGVNPGTGSGVSLTPTLQYLHSANKEARTVRGSALDLGAYEFTGANVEAPTVSFSAGNSTVDYGASVQLTWSTQHADSCVASGGWSGAKGVAGTETSKTLAFKESFTIRCDGRGGSVTETIEVAVRENPAVENYADYAFERIPDTKLRPLCTETFPFKGTVGCDGKGRNSTIAYVPDLNTLYLFGGGSRNYFGNEVFALDLDEMELSKVFGPTDPRDTTSFNENHTWVGDVILPCSPIWTLTGGGVVPPPLLPYSAFMYLADVGKIYMHGGQVACGGSAQTTAGWLFDPQTASWELQYSRSAGPEWSYGAYLTQRDIPIVAGSRGIFRFDAGSKQLVKLSSSRAPYPWVGANSVYDPRHELMLIMGFYDNREYFSAIDLSGVTSQSVSAPPLQGWKVTGDTTLLRRKIPGLAYDSVNGHLVGWDGGDKIYFIELDKETKTANFIAKRISGGPRAGHNGYGFFTYVPALKSFVIFSDVDEDFFLLKQTAPASGAPAEVPQVPERRPVTCNLNAVPGNIDQGDSTKLSWGTKNASAVSITGIGAVGSDGSRTITPSADTTYTLTATGAEGSVTCATKVNVTAEAPTQGNTGNENTQAGNQNNGSDNGNAASGGDGNDNSSSDTNNSDNGNSSNSSNNSNNNASGNNSSNTDDDSNVSSNDDDDDDNSSSSGGGGGRRSSRDNSSSRDDDDDDSDVTLTRRSFSRGVSHPDVRDIQRLLNRDPDTRIAATGAGSPGNETNFFGGLTVDAIKRFQRKYNIVSAGTPATTGYGNLGPRTLAKLMEVYDISITAPAAGSGVVSGGSGGGRFTSALDFGESGAEVSVLQRYLATDPTLYPEGLVTGYFGTLTQRAVERFQARFNIVSSGSPQSTGFGRVGPSTRSLLNQIYGGIPIPPIPTSLAPVSVPSTPQPPQQTPPPPAPVSAASAPTSASSGGVLFSRSLQLGDSGDDVAQLQRLLSEDPTIYPAGNITGSFTPLTELAVRRFQSTYGIVSSGSPQTTGYGLVGPQTQAKLLEVFGRP